jgi:hypothetical protein
MRAIADRGAVDLHERTRACTDTPPFTRNRTAARWSAMVSPFFPTTR